jgi:hypothetical protein
MEAEEERLTASAVTADSDMAPVSGGISAPADSPHMIATDTRHS